ncbi:MAG: NUDIX hydrolase [Nitrosopumilales archaeon]|nr:MAG: NUDIX hydrolase [Nitrosopumilales archaeon]
MNEVSAGAIIFRKNSGLHYLLLHYPSGHWDFVKGKIEINENPNNTVVRETKEETGITDLVFVNGFEESIQYDFRYDGKLIHKKVIFFLAKTNTEKIKISHEHLDFVWLEFKEALKKISYQSARSVLSGANQLLADRL